MYVMTMIVMLSFMPCLRPCPVYYFNKFFFLFFFFKEFNKLTMTEKQKEQEDNGEIDESKLGSLLSNIKLFVFLYVCIYNMIN